MLTPQRRAQMDAVVGKTNTTTSLTPERRAQMDAVLGRNKPSASGFAGNVISSAFNNAKDIGSAILNVANPNPEKNTIMNMSNLAQGTGQLLDPTKGNKLVQASNKITSHILPFMRPFLNPKNKNLEQMPKNVGQFYADRYGSPERIRQTVYSDPVGVGLDVATVATGVGGLAKGGASAAARAGQMGVASNLAKTGSALTKVGTMADPFMMGAKVAAKPFSMAGKPLVNRMSSRLNSQKLVTQGLGNPSKQTAQTFKRTPVSYLTEKYNLYDRSPVTASNAKSSVLSQYDELALQSGKTTPLQAIIEPLNKRIKELSSGDHIYMESSKRELAELLKRRQDLYGRFSKPGTRTETLQPPTAKPPTSPLSALKQEARKYKSAEEFADKKLIRVYHGADKRNIEALNNDFKILTPEEKLKYPSTGGGNIGLSTTTDINTAKQYSQALGNADVGEFYLSPKAKILKTKEYIDDVYTAQDVENLQKQGYDAIMSTADESEVRILSNKNVLTKSQLTDLYNQSTTPKGKVKVETPTQRTFSFTNLNPDVGIDEVTLFRKKLDKDISKNTSNLDAMAQGKEAGTKAVRDSMRDVINSSDPRIKQLGLDYGGLKELEKIFEAYTKRRENRQLVGLPKLLSGGAGGVIGGFQGFVGGVLMESFLNSPEFSAFVYKTMKKRESSKLPKVDQRIKQAPRETYLFGRAGRMFTDRDQSNPVSP